MRSVCTAVSTGVGNSNLEARSPKPGAAYNNCPLPVGRTTQRNLVSEKMDACDLTHTIEFLKSVLSGEDTTKCMVVKRHGRNKLKAYVDLEPSDERWIDRDRLLAAVNLEPTKRNKSAISSLFAERSETRRKRKGTHDSVKIVKLGLSSQALASIEDRGRATKKHKTKRADASVSHLESASRELRDLQQLLQRQTAQVQNLQENTKHDQQELQRLRLQCVQQKEQIQRLQQQQQSHKCREPKLDAVASVMPAPTTQRTASKVTQGGLPATHEQVKTYISSRQQPLLRVKKYLRSVRLHNCLDIIVHVEWEKVPLKTWHRYEDLLQYVHQDKLDPGFSQRKERLKRCAVSVDAAPISERESDAFVCAQDNIVAHLADKKWQRFLQDMERFRE